MSDKKISLTIFLIKEERLGSFEQEVVVPLAERQIPLSGRLDGVFIPLPPADGGIPAWVEPITSILAQPIQFNMTARSPGGLLIIRYTGRTFVITFGHAWQKLDDTWLERDFGLRVALNVIPRKELVEVRAEQIFARWHLASERAPRASSVEEFGVDFDRDLVAVLEGVPSNLPRLGKTIRGSTSLKVNLPIAQLEGVLEIALERFTSTDYKLSWPEIDKIHVVKDGDILQLLEDQLDSDLGDEMARKKMVMFTPSQRRGEPIIADSYIYGRQGKSSPWSPYLSLESWMSYLSRQGLSPSLETAKGCPVHIYDDSGAVTRDVSAFDCLGYEYSDGQRVYILSSGLWYEVSTDFVATINDAISKIPHSTSQLIPWNRSDSEGEYNVKCSATNQFLNCDAKNVFFGGAHSQLEFCDMLDEAGKTLLFAKIVSKSSGMSHLTEQIRRTAQLLFGTDAAYRQSLTALFGRHYPDFDVTWLQSRPKNGDWNLCMVSLGRKASELPFFAKCGLAKTYKDLTEQGHSVSFMHV